MPGRWADLRLRMISAAVLVPLALACVWFGGVAFDLLMVAATAGLGAEWWGLVRKAWPRASLPPCGGGSGRGGVRSASSPRAEAPLPPPPIPVGPLRGPTLHNSGGRRLAAFSSQAPLLLAGLLYILLAAASLAWIRADPLAGRANLIVLLLLVWASDVGAYAAGRMIGGARLAPRISPGKTIAGAIGGLAAAIAVGVLAAATLSHAANLLRAGLLAAALGVVAQAGDLLESWVKRRFGVKDSGSLIPGHGGLFDRLDALLAAAPAAALLALWAGRGLAWWQ